MKRYKLILLISCFIFIYGCKKTSNTFEKEDLKLFSNPILTYIENDKVVGEYFVNGKTELEEVTIDDFKSYIDENMDKIKSGEVGVTDEGKFLIDKYLKEESEQIKNIDTKIEITTGEDVVRSDNKN